LKKFYSNKIDLKKGNLPNKYYFAQVMVGWFKRSFMIKMWKRNMLCSQSDTLFIQYTLYHIFTLHNIIIKLLHRKCKTWLYFWPCQYRI
jgi:hypothetical protein